MDPRTLKIPEQNQLNTIDPLRFLGSSLFDSSANMSFAGSIGYQVQTKGLLANTYMTRATGPLDDCQTTFQDPMDDILNAYREIGLRISVAQGAENATPGGLAAVPPQPQQQTVPYTSVGVRVQYGVDWRNAAAAVVVGLLGPAASLLLLWGWWQLGRDFSLSPLELANVFGGGPGTAADAVARAAHGNAEAEELVRLLRGGGAARADLAVRYGVVPGSNRLGVGLGVGGQGGVRAPQAGELL